ncbi:hypothetical protein Peur_024161 [Populus x canadensis]
MTQIFYLCQNRVKEEAANGRFYEDEEEANVEVQDIEKSNANDLVEERGVIQASFRNCFIDCQKYNFSATCRLFRSEAPPNQWDMVSNEMETHSSSQWLMFFEKDNICMFINPRSVRNIPRNYPSHYLDV